MCGCVCVYEVLVFTPLRFGNPGDLVGKIEGTVLDYNEDFGFLKPS